MRRMETFRCSEIVAFRGGAKSDKNDKDIIKSSLLAAPVSNWLAPPVVLNWIGESASLCTASKPAWRCLEQSGLEGV